MKRRTGKVELNRKKKATWPVLFAALILIVFMLTYAYAAFSDELGVTGTIAKVRIDKVVRVNGVTTSSGYVSDLDYSHSSILSEVVIPANASITYSVTATNLGNVPMAVAGVSFTNTTGSAISGFTADINSNNYIKICNNNNQCTNNVSKTFDVTITNTTNETISSNIRVVLTFVEVYTISYAGNQIGEALKGANFSYTFTSNIPTKVAKSSGTCSSFNYENNTLTITNVGSNLTFVEAHSIIYNGEYQGYAVQNDTYTYTFQSQWPATVTKDSGTSGALTYQNHTITIPNVTSDIYLTGIIGNVSLTRIDYVSSKNVVNPTDPANQPTFSGMDAEFNVTFRKEEGSTDDEFEIIYEVDLTNTHYNDYIFRGFDFHPEVNASTDTDTATLTLTPVGVDNGDIVAADSVKTFRIVLTLIPNNPSGSYETGSTTQVDTTPDTEEETGEITASITPVTGDLRSPNTSAAFTLSVTSTYPSDREFSLIANNANLVLLGGNSLTIHGESTETYNLTVEPATGAQFVGNTDTLAIYLSTEGIANISVGTLTFNVDKYSVPDTTKVTVGNAQLSYYYDTSDSKPKIKATWDRIDYGGTRVTNYVAAIRKSNSTTADQTINTNSDSRVALFDNVSSGTTYYVVVYGIDEAPNSGQEDVPNATTANGYATRSPNASFTWVFSVNTNNLSSLSSSGGSTAIKGSTWTSTIKATGTLTNNQVPDDLTVTMEGTSNLSNGNGYDYTKNSTNQATLKIYNVSGNITLRGSASCLVEGTKILLANGKYKNIENINYDDLLMVHNYETGELTQEYPIWIEKEKRSISYQENTFSDGTVLKTVGWHGLFETDLNKFVSVDNPEEFHVGSKIAKYNNKTKKYETITVTKIETKYEIVNYYHIVSTRYYNIIANNLLTTDGTTILSNLYGFKENITWPKEIRDNAIKDVYTYDELKDAIPYYMFKGLRAEEGKILANYGLDLNTFKEYLKNNQNNKDLLKEPINFLGNNMWMVTTSIDNITDLNKHNYLKPEGSIYTLPKLNNKKAKWLNTADNKIYNQLDKIKVSNSMHFILIYE